MDKKTYEYMKKRVNDFEKNKNRIEQLKNSKEVLQYLETGNSPSLRLFGRDNYELSLTISQFNTIKNVLINELNVKIEGLEKEIEEI